MRESSVPKLALGLSLLLLGMLLFFGRNSKVTQSTTFEDEPVVVENLLDNKPDESKVPKKILIPDLGIDLEVKKSEIINGYWEVFDATAGWGIGSGLPGESGNQVIFPHAKKGLFLPLQTIEVGEKIYILTNSGWFSYETVEIKEVYPTQTEVIAPTEDESLTLYTCSGFADNKRLIVVAKRI